MKAWGSLNLSVTDVQQSKPGMPAREKAVNSAGL